MLREGLGDYCFPQDILFFCTHLIQGKGAMASDGSLLNQSCASHGWKLHSKVSKEQASGHSFLSSGGGGLRMSSPGSRRLPGSNGGDGSASIQETNVWEMYGQTRRTDVGVSLH